MTTIHLPTGVTLDALTEEAVARRSEAVGEPDWLRDRRLEAYKRWADLEWPQLRGDELWRDTPFSRFSVDLPLAAPSTSGVALGGSAIDPSPLWAASSPAMEAADGAALPQTVPAVLLDGLTDLAARVDIVDATVRVWTSEALTGSGVVVADLSTASREHEGLVREYLGRLTGDHDRTVTANDAAWTTGVLVYVPPEVELALPIGISVQLTSSVAQLPRVLVVADRHTAAQVFIEHVSADVADPATVDEVVEAFALDGARLDIVTLQDWRGRVGHLSLQALELHRDAQVRHLTVTIGGETVRLRPEVHLVGPGSRVEPLGVYFSDDQQHFEHHPFIEHVAGHAVSDVLYKGALQGRSRTVFRGHIYIHKQAVGSDSNETNKSLILTPGAKADSTPFLEIECSEVVAGHGSATGQVDENQLFYLHSRGIPPGDALRLVVFGFFSEVLQRIGIPAVRDRTMAHITEELEHADLETLGRRRPQLAAAAGPGGGP